MVEFSFECGDTWVPWTYGTFSVSAVCLVFYLGSSDSIGAWRENKK